MFNSSINLILFLLSALVISFVLTWLVRKIAIRKSIIDLPNERSSHTVPTPRGGGIAIAITWFLGITFLFFEGEISLELFLALLCGLPIAFIGFVDDLISISPKVRFTIQLVSSISVLIIFKGINNINLGFSVIEVPYFLSVMAILGIIWFTNLFNFLDGIDGYLGAEVFFIGIVAMLFFGNIPLLMLSAIVLGFLIWNWQPAKIFMGDVGSTLIGFTIGVFIAYSQKSSETSIFIWLILTSLFWFDATLTLYRRWRNGEPLLMPHKKHANQRLVQAGYSHQRVVFYAQILNISLILFIWLAFSFSEISGLLLLLNIVYFYIIVKLIDRKFPFAVTKSLDNA